MADWQITPEDRWEIQDLYARYAWGIDLADADMALSAFSKDAFFDHLWQGRVHGHDAIRKNLESLWYDRQSWWYGRQHIMNTHLMTPRDDGKIDCKCFFQILQFNVEYRNNFVFGIGTRQDVIVKEDGKWLFEQLHVNAWTDMSEVPWQGELTMKSKTGAPATKETAQ